MNLWMKMAWATRRETQGAATSMCWGSGRDLSLVVVNDSRMLCTGMETPAEAKDTTLSSARAVILPWGKCSPDSHPPYSVIPRKTQRPREACLLHAQLPARVWQFPGLQPITLGAAVVTTHRVAPPAGESVPRPESPAPAPTWRVVCCLVPQSLVPPGWWLGLWTHEKQSMGSSCSPACSCDTL